MTVCIFMYSQFLATNTKFFLGKLNKEYCIFTRTKTGVLYMFYFRCHEIYIRTGNVDSHCFFKYISRSNLPRSSLNKNTERRPNIR